VAGSGYTDEATYPVVNVPRVRVCGGGGVAPVLFSNTGDDNWMFVTCDGAGQTITDTGVAVSPGAPYLLAVDASIEGQIKGAVNLEEKASHATTLPDATTPLTPYVRLRTLAGESRFIGTSSFEQDSE
jgi:hypothetical protein